MTRSTPRQLMPGAVVRRYTEPAPGGGLDVPVPCCARLAWQRDVVTGHPLAASPTRLAA
jgi:hypothetical protein